MKRSLRYEATGSVAHTRISPLMPADWIDSENTDRTDSNSNTATTEDTTQPDFLWENATRRETKEYRDTVSVYSHLPNGLNILDSKWVLGRIFDERREDDSELLATLETHCFRGRDGFHSFCDKVGMWEESQQAPLSTRTGSKLVDLSEGSISTTEAVEPNNLWVVKDAQANGAGGIWVVDPSNAKAFGNDSKNMFPDHKYVAQKYVWPPVLFGGRKCHVRVYGLLASDGRAFVHHRAFLHVANDPFTTTSSNTEQSSTSQEQGEAFEDSVHITNCCANSHDDSKFAGEILADFETTTTTERDGQTVIPLAQYFPSVQACVAGLAKRVFPFLHGGQANHGFEYLGMDFILAHDDKTGTPLAYLLEINAPPSQDTATGLPHAENLHDDVIRDLISLWVLPNVPGTLAMEQPGGWRCVYQDDAAKQKASDARQKKQQPIVPSKAAIINKIRWAIFERKAAKREQTKCSKEEEPKPKEGTKDQKQVIAAFARSQFPYFLCSTTTTSDDDSTEQSQEQIFFENAGGSQVAQVVIDSITASLSFRHRTVVGTRTKQAARETFQRLLGARPIDPIVLGANASSLLSSLADLYVQLGLLTDNDEIVISSENHLANVQPWERAAQAVGATIRWWTPVGVGVQETSSANLEDLLNANTRLVALPHASNVLGQIRDIEWLTSIIKQKTLGRAHVVVDGVAASPHVFANLNRSQSDWYVVSGHKLFGPHVGGLYGRKDGAIDEILEASGEESGDAVYSLLEKGTVNYEGCAGIVGLGQYIDSLACCNKHVHENKRNGQSLQHAGESGQRTSTRPNILEPSLSIGNAKEAYENIRIVEEPLAEALLAGLRQFPKVKIIEGNEMEFRSMMRLPIVSWLHEDIPVDVIYNVCDKNGISCRVSSFLCTQMLADCFGFETKKGLLRVSLAHYNTVQEVHWFLECLKTIPGFV